MHTWGYRHNTNFSIQVYAEIFERGRALMREATAALGLADIAEADGKNLVAVNTLPWSRAEIAKVPAAASSTSGDSYRLLRSDGGVGSVQELSTASQYSAARVEEIEEGVFQLSNNDYKVKIKDGVITSLFDLQAKREVIPKGSKANQFVIFDDKPLYWQAWDVELYHLDTRQELRSGATRILDRGPERVSVVTETRVSNKSWVKTTISLSASIEGYSSYVEMASEVEWRETMKFLKVEFPVDIRNTEASYETQYGIVKRPTHYNTRYGHRTSTICQ
jgi:alpha-mannosidase